MATGLYWCLVLTECLSLVACGKCILLPIYHCISTASLTQTTPSYTPVCPGDRLIFACVVTGSGGALVWRRNKLVILQYNQPIPSIPEFILNITSYNNNTTELVSTATNESATIQLDGSNIGCSADGINYMTLTIDIAGKIQKIVNYYIHLNYYRSTRSNSR